MNAKQFRGESHPYAMHQVGSRFIHHKTLIASETDMLDRLQPQASAAVSVYHI
jgi:hypothetical protein